MSQPIVQKCHSERSEESRRFAQGRLRRSNLRSNLSYLFSFLLIGIFSIFILSCGNLPSGLGGTGVTVSSVGNVEGTVTDASTGALLSGVTVQIGDKSANTNNNGVYTILEVSVGSRTITATKIGYQTYTDTVDVSKGTTVTKNIQLTSEGVSDTTAPSNTTGSNFINNGASSTSSISATLTISASDDVGVTGYYASENSATPSPNVTGWISITSTSNYSSTVLFSLSSGSGTKTVYIWFRDSAGNISASASDSIDLILSDTSAPSSPSISINNGDDSTTSMAVTLSLSAIDDVGVTSYCAKESSTTPENNDTCWTTVASATSYSASVSFTLSSGSGTKTIYVWFRDDAGNISVSANDTISLSASEQVAGATIYTNPDSFNSSTASLGTATVVNFEGATACAGDTIKGCTAFDGTFYSSNGITFSNPNGYPLYIAPAGLFWNSSKSLSIGRFPFDPLSPKAPEYEDDDLIITFSTPVRAVGFDVVDSTSPQIEFKDSDGNIIKTTGLSNDYTSYRTFVGIVSTDSTIKEVNIIDAGNDGDDANYDDVVFYPVAVSDSTAPSSPSISINNGDDSTTSTAVTLTLSAADNVGVTAYYTSETSTTPLASVSGWTSVTSTTSYSATVSFTLSSGDGTKTVYVWFRDSAGNVSASASDSITYSPVSSTITLSKTGQTTSYATGDDGDLQKGVTSPSPRFTVGTGTEADCISDNLTGLMWVKKSDNTTRTWQQALDYANGLTLCGYSDWRLPNRKELRSLINYGQSDVVSWLQTQGFGNIVSWSSYSSSLWSSTTDVSNTVKSLYVEMDSGLEGSSYKTDSIHILPVRAGNSGTIQLPETGQTTCYDTSGNIISCTDTGQDGDIKAGVTWPSPRFIVGTGTEADCITDNLTGLMWVKSPDSTGRTWGDALAYANNLSLCGYTDWRLPNINELESLTNAEQSNLASWLNAQGFSNLKAHSYCSATTDGDEIYDFKWNVDMTNGSVESLWSSSYYVLPVRGGQ